jgi:outer membrane receptor for ferrienterochelin and colicins
MSKFLISSAVLLFIFSGTITSQTIDSVKVNKLNEVVVTAQFFPQSEKNSIYKVKTINRNTIEAKAVTNLTELLRLELNIDFSHNPVFGAGIELQGVSKENIKILIDGVPLIGRVNGVLNLNQINIENIERIEIIEGPVSVFYGTDALGGIINLITKKTQKEKFLGSLSGFYEDIDAKDFNANIGYKQGENNFKFGVGYYFFNGLNTDEVNIRSLNWPKRQQQNSSFKFTRNMGDFKLLFSSDFSKELVHTLGEIKRGKATDIDYTTKRFDNTLNFQGNLKNGNYIDITASYLNYDRFDTSFNFNSETESIDLIVDNPNENANYFDTFYAKAQYANSNLSSKLKYVIGTEFELDQGKGNRILEGEQSVHNTSLFASINYKLTDQFEIQPALRYTNNSSFNSLWSPALNLKYRFNSNSVVRFAYGKGYRAPSLKELYLSWTPTFGPFSYVFSGNENLLLESSHSFNLYYSYGQYFNNKSYFSIEPSIAYNEIKDLIGLSELVNFERHYINLNKIKSLNTAIQLKYNINELKVNLGFSYLGRYIEYSDAFDSNNFMFTPSINSSISYLIKPLHINVHVFYKYSGKREGHFIEEVEGVDVLQETIREDFSNLDVSLSKSFLNNKIMISIGAKNLFNITDIETVNQIGVAHERDIQLWGKSLFLRTKINF